MLEWLRRDRANTESWVILQPDSLMRELFFLLESVGPNVLVAVPEACSPPENTFSVGLLRKMLHLFLGS